MTRTASLFPAAAGAIGGTPEKNGGLDRHYSTTILATCSPNILRQTAAPGTRRSTGSGTGQCRALTWRTDRDPLRPHRSWLELPRAVFERVFRWPAWPYSLHHRIPGSARVAAGLPPHTQDQGSPTGTAARIEERVPPEAFPRLDNELGPRWPRVLGAMDVHAHRRLRASGQLPKWQGWLEFAPRRRTRS